VRRFPLLHAYKALIALTMPRNPSSHAILRPAKISLDRRRASVSGVCGQALAIFRTALHGGRFNWEKFLDGDINALISAYGSAASHNQEPAAEIRQKSTAHFVSEAEEQVTKRWPNRAGIVRLVYAVLSDVCHPSRGGDLLFADGPFVEGWTKRRVEPSDEILGYFLHMFAMPVFLNVAGVAFAALDSLQFLADGFTNDAPRDVPAA
jgi:hypothetical protein